MFRLLARWLEAARTSATPAAPAAKGDFETLFTFHPMQLHRYLEHAWAAGGFEPYAVPPATSTSGVFLGDPQVVGVHRLPPGLLDTLQSGIATRPATPLPPVPFYDATNPPPGLGATAKQPWEHLVYAYLIENTGVMQIFRRVLELYASGEKLEVPSIATRGWLRATEELFFRDPPPFHISSLTSYGRPDLEASRRNAYWRMFGMDLNHGGADGRPYPYNRGSGGNRDFVPQWEGFLQEVWQGFINRRNSSGENYSDPEAVANRADALAQIMDVRRMNGNLAREEFFFTAMMSWFHLTLEDNTSVVVDLKALATSPAERLRKIGERVGIAPHPKARSFFELAEPASSILRFLELKKFSEPGPAEILYDLTVPNPVREDVLVVINHWSIATGRDLKLRRPSERTSSPGATRPTMRPRQQSPQPQLSAFPSAGPPAVNREDENASNGHRF